MVAGHAIDPELYPFEGRYVEVGGHRMHVLDEGEGPTILMVHGNPTWSFYYRQLVLALRGTHRVVVPDHVGCGLSDKPARADYAYSLESRVADLDAMVESLDLGDEVTLVLHDWGGMIGMAWAGQNPERVARVVLMNTAAFPNPKGQKLPLALRLIRDTPLGSGLVLGFNAFARGATRMAVTKRPMARDVAEAYCAPYDSWSNRIATLRFVEDIPLGPEHPSYQVVTDTAERLALFGETPALICWGREDFVFDDAFLEDWRRRWPHAEVHVHEGCGHYVLEDATEDVIGEIQSFLDRHPLGGAQA